MLTLVSIRRRVLYYLLFIMTVTVVTVKAQNDNVTFLRNNWAIQSSEKVAENGETISTEKYSPVGWYPAIVPSTIMGNLVNDSVYNNIFYAENLAKVDTNQFRKPWWYRRVFVINKMPEMNNVFLRFNGIIYRADIFVNGHKIAGKDSVFGVYRRFDFNVTRYINRNGKNYLAVKIYPPKLSDPSVGFVDWNPRPPDNNMGIWRNVSVKVCGNASVNFPFVKSKIDLKTLKKAELTVSTEVSNNSDKELRTLLKGEINKISFSKEVILLPGQRKLVEFTPREFPDLIIKNPHLWWTHDIGNSYLYKLKLKLFDENNLADEVQTGFGIREVSDYINKEGYRGYKLNGKKILIRGAGWAPNLFLQYNPEKFRAQINYVKHIGLNAIRFEGFWGNSRYIYNLCDQNGILLMVGFSCQWEWPEYINLPADDYGAIKMPKDIKLVSEYWRDQIKWLRNHPSIFVWLYGSDKYPRPELEKKYLRILKKDDPTRPSLSSAQEITSIITGRSAVKMYGPYDYVPPIYWTTDKKYGGAYGFNTETGPGPQIPPIESMKKMIPQKDLWPMDTVMWNYHSGRHTFHNLDTYNKALFMQYGKPNSIEEYCTKAQLQNYDAMRAMYEAFTINRPVATGIIQWMLNSAWPEFYWQLYDYYLLPNGAFYGAKIANEPAHIAYDYANHGIVAVNNTFKTYKNLTANVRVLRFDLSQAYSFKKEFNLFSDASKLLTIIPELKNLSKTYFLVLNLKNENSNIVSRNFYSLSSKPVLLDTAKTTWFVTPIKQYADFTELNKLGTVKLDVSSKFISKVGTTEVKVEIVNNSNKLAFQIRLIVKKGRHGKNVLPIFWDDNYFSLLPGEKRTIKGYFSTSNLDGNTPKLEVTGWNVKE